MASSTAILVIRSVVVASLREPFDRWYETDHLPDAAAALQADRARRFWSTAEPGVHHAMYEFADVETMQNRISGPEMDRLVRVFDKAWPEGVERRREVLALAQAIPAEVRP
ncbi:hypothetical protein [Amycolatopsis jejuensis]|uniref:hypothetical protein n=1 Tax=Amycolatopsis jejuensis TaxID=330084 RepID=UPI000524CA89|nr:hypothetical protein [Amycolatopsis jejuensis]